MYSEETRKKVSESIKRSWIGRSRLVSDGTRKKRSDSLKKAYAEGRHSKYCGNYWALKKYHDINGWNHSDETKRKMSEIRKGMKFTDEHRKNLSISHLGKKPVGIRKSLKGFKHTDVARRNMSEGQKKRYAERPVTYKVRMNMSEAHKSDVHIKRAKENIIDILRRRESGAEKLLREKLVDCGVGFERQYVVNDGEFIFDFKIGDNLLLECDSEYWHSSPQMVSQDHKKNVWAKKNGFNLIRVKEDDVLKGKFSIRSVI